MIWLSSRNTPIISISLWISLLLSSLVLFPAIKEEVSIFLLQQIFQPLLVTMKPWQREKKEAQKIHTRFHISKQETQYAQHAFTCKEYDYDGWVPFTLYIIRMIKNFFHKYIILDFSFFSPTAATFFPHLHQHQANNQLRFWYYF